MKTPTHLYDAGDILRFTYRRGEYLYMEVISADMGRNNYKVLVIKCMSDSYRKGAEKYFNLPRRCTKKITEGELLIGML